MKTITLSAVALLALSAAAMASPTQPMHRGNDAPPAATTRLALAQSRSSAPRATGARYSVAQQSGPVGGWRYLGGAGNG